MNRPRWRKVWADLVGSPVRTLLVVLSIAVGVFAVGTVGGAYLVLSETFSVGYLAANPAHASLYVTPFDDDVISAARRVPGVAEAEGRRTLAGLRLLVGPDTWKDLTITVLPDLEAVRIGRLRLEQGAAQPGPRGLVVERTSLPLTGAQIGDTLTVELADGRQRQLTLAGTVFNAASAPATLTNQIEAYLTEAGLEWLGETRYYDQLDLTVTDNRLDAAHIEAVAKQVAERIERTGRTVFYTVVPTPGQHPAYQVIQSLILLLGAVGLFSLFLSSFLVVNTLNGLLAQHVRQIGMMKAIGARTGQIVRMYLALVLGFGVLAFLLAAPLATGAAYLLCTNLAAALNFDLAAFQMPPLVIAGMAAISLVVPMLAALGPVLRGARLTVREAIASYGLGRGHFGRSWFDQILERVRALSRPLLISLRNTFRRKGRLALTLITLTLAGAIFIAVFNVRASLTVAINGFLDTFLSDVNLSFTGGPQQIAEVRQVALAIPEVTGLEAWVGAAGKLLNADGRAVDNLTVIGVPPESTMIKPILEQGRWLQPGDQSAVVVGTDFLARYPDLQPGRQLPATLNERRVTLTVVGVMRFLGTSGGNYVLYAPYDYLGRVTNAGSFAGEYRLALRQTDLATQQRVAQALLQAFEARQVKAFVQTSAELKAQVSQGVNLIIAFLAPMAVMVGLVGALGLAGTMSLNVLERTREIGVMRAVGAANGKVFQIVVVEGLLIGLLSWGLGLLLALPMSAGLAAIVGAIFAVDLQVAVSVEGFVIWLAVVLGLAWLASLLPAWNAVRLTVRDVLAYE